MNEYIYGRNASIEAIKNNKNIVNVYLSEGSLQNNKDIVSMLENKKINYFVKKKEFLNKLALNNQGVVIETLKYEYSSLQEIMNNSTEGLTPVIVMLDGLMDVHNLGAIARSVEIVKGNGIIIPKNRSVSVNATVAKVSTGAIEKIKIAQVTNLVQTIDELKKNGWWIVGAEALDESKSMYDMKFDMKTCLVIGSEGNGISRLVRENCDFLVKIPMWGEINSLNASVSCSILLYEIRR